MREERIKVARCTNRAKPFVISQIYGLPVGSHTDANPRRDSTNSRDKKLSIEPDERKLAGNWSSPGQQSIETARRDAGRARIVESSALVMQLRSNRSQPAFRGKQWPGTMAKMPALLKHWVIR